MAIVRDLGREQLRKQERTKSRLRSVVPYLYLVPVFAFLLLFLLQPFVLAFIKSFYRYDGLTINEFVGWKNYYTLFFVDEKFWISMWNLLYFFIGMVICFLFPILVAELIYNLPNKRHQNFFRTLMIIPIVVPLVVTVLVWKFLYYPGIGVFAQIFDYFGITAPNFLGSEAWVKPSLILIGFPWVAGLPLLVIYAALQGLDMSVIEASRMDGCSTIRRVFTIDIPAIMPQIKALFVLAVIGLVQDYEKIFILTQGGPNNASLVPGMHMYSVAFLNSSNDMYGYACAMAVVLFILTMVITLLTLRVKKEK